MRLKQQDILLYMFLCINILCRRHSLSQTRNQVQKAINKYFQELSSTMESPDEDLSTTFYKQRQSNKNTNLRGLKLKYRNFSELDLYLGGKSKYLTSFRPFLKKNMDFKNLDEEHLKVLLNEVFNEPRNHIYNKDLKTSVGLLIGWIFAQNGSIVGVQNFSPKQFLYLFGGKEVEGLNIISILPGAYWGTPMDKIIVVGSHYDTVEISAGYNDNGSGTTALLKIHQNLSKSKKCSGERRFSIIFVAFDLEEYGFHGSHAFVEEFLKPQIIDKFNQTDFQFAFILDSIMNYNKTEGSQKLYNDASSSTSAYHDFVMGNKQRGDYISLVGRGKEESALIDEVKRDMKIKTTGIILEDLDITSMDKLSKHFNYLRSDHIKFWFANLTAIAVTDTGNLRGIMQTCYHNSCDHPSLNTTGVPFANMNFLNGIIDGITNMIDKHSC
ncbi:uncharacterized protein [Lepeophtheirus salmonis]|uniref:uncharacterized protein n=1 Tax=Lepeophtheirus salmonis TaxID=72036 RepID=UPI001AEB97B1|nr:uncharacterized protein LOC121132381 [Lepeophtheirus salmonis]